MEHWNNLRQTKSRGRRHRASTGESEDSEYELLKQASGQEEHAVEPHIEQEDSLSYLQATLFATIMEDTIAQLRIMDESNNELRIIKALSNKDFLIREKFSVPQPTVADEFNNKNVQFFESDKYKLNKLANDMKYCTDSLTSTYLDLALWKRYGALTNANIVVIQQNEYYNCLLEDEAKNKLTRRELLKQVRQKHNYVKSVLYDTNGTIEGLRSELEDLNLVSEIKGRYINNWQLARAEQNIQNVTDKESEASNNIKYYRGRHENELRVHSEVELITNIYITETLTKVEHWMDKYDIDMESMDLKIQLMKNQCQDQTEDRIEMEQTLQLHAKDIEAWLHFKDEREKARQYALKMTNAAIAVQSWWRGLLVRLQLGPFKPVRKKTAPARKEKNKK